MSFSNLMLFEAQKKKIAELVVTENIGFSTFEYSIVELILGYYENLVYEELIGLLLRYKSSGKKWNPFGFKFNSKFWNIIHVYEHLSEPFIERYKAVVDWKFISMYRTLSVDFIERFHSFVDWKFIFRSQALDEDFIEKHIQRVDWECICIYQTLSEDFITRYLHLVNWDAISKNQVLSEYFISRWSHLVNWGNILDFQDVSPEFVDRHRGEIDLFFGLFR